MEKWWMCNVVWYDGVDAFVSKFVLQADVVNGEGGITEESKHKVRQYLSGNGELLKIDRLYPVVFENIIALRDCESSTVESEKELFAAYDRFKNMWF